MNLMLSKQRVRDLLRAGVPKSAIAREVGCSRSTVKRIAAEIATKTGSEAYPERPTRCAEAGHLHYGSVCLTCLTESEPDCRVPDGELSDDLGCNLQPGPRGRWLRLRRRKLREEAARALPAEVAMPPARRLCQAEWTAQDAGRLLQVMTAVAMAAVPPLAASVWLCGFAIDREEEGKP
jgi:hypothetical protein